jgi:glycosyltransferase involved in cell wall biosynthesis
MISCLTITMPTPERFEMLKKSITSYRSQSFKDRELVVIVGSSKSSKCLSREVTARIADQIFEFIEQLNDPTIRAVNVDGDRTLGELRNISVSHAFGEIICQWDDDDIYHPNRLSDQLDFLQSTNSDANILSEVLMLLSKSSSIFYTNWSNTPFKGFSGSLMCKKNSMPKYPECGENSMLGEDSYIIERLLSLGRLEILRNKAYLITYVAHGENSWSPEFFEMIQSTLSISKGLLERKRQSLLIQMEFLQLGIHPLNFKSSNGDVFTYTPPKPISDIKDINSG